MKKLTGIYLLVLIFIGGCGEKTAATKKLDEKLVQVGIMVIEWPKSITSNTDFIIKSKIINSGEITLPSLGKDDYLLKVGISYHWKLIDGNIVIWDGLLTSLKHDLKKNEEQNIDISIKSPKNPGAYILEIDLLQSNAFWFGGVGSQTAQMIINVK